MSSSIPYDHPSLVLGNIVDTRVLNLLKQSGNLQNKIDAAREKMNSYVMMKRSLAMTINELTDMNVDVSDMRSKIQEIDTSITTSATEFMNVCLENEKGIQQMREQLYELDTANNPESPVDFSKSVIKRLPLSAESMKLDAQYFSFGSNQEDDVVASIEKYVRESTSNLGPQSGAVAKTATAQINQQRQNHNLAGTLIITASCTHRNVAIIEPCVLEPDKAIAVWNSLYPDSQDRIITTDPAQVKAQAESSPDVAGEKTLTVLSGVVYGSGFVGMVHILKRDVTDSGPTEEVATQLQERLAIGGWLENASGGFGVDATVMDEVKKILSTQSISSHVSMIVMGAVPSIASNQLQLGVRKVLQPDPDKLSGYLATLSSGTLQDSMDSAADESRTANRLLTMQTASIQSVMQGLGQVDHGSNKMLDINSMMTAFENYLQAIRDKEESTGVPVNFYLKQVSRRQLLEVWLEKYYPRKDAPATTNS